ncbi:hypothetical protein HGM15179_003769, partial [Zosterops borbonicus]
RGNPERQYREGKPQPWCGAVQAEQAGRWTPTALTGPVEELLIFFFFFSFFIFSPPAARGGQPCPAGEMQWRGVAVLAALQAQLPATDAASVLGLTDPRLCYVLDGLLFIYAVIMTALFVKAKLSQASEPQLRPGQDDVYNKLSRGHRDDYDVLGGRRGADPELGGRHQQRRKNPQDTVYTSLQKDKMGEAYSEIGMKGEQRRRGKGNEGLYQGLSAATKDTYDALQMQPLPPR